MNEHELILEALEHYSWWLESCLKSIPSTSDRDQVVRGKMKTLSELILRLGKSDNDENIILRRMLERLEART